MKGAERSRGRPWVYNVETARSIAESIGEGASKKQACENAGAAYSSFMRWQRQKPSLRRLVKKAEADSMVAGGPGPDRCADHAGERGGRLSAVYDSSAV